MLGRVPVLVSVVLAGVLLLPTVFMGFYADDYVHQLVLRGGDATGPMRPWALFDFGTRADWEAYDLKVGAFPWWTGQDWGARFFRPLASLLLWGGHAAFGSWSLGYHLVGLALHVVLLFGVCRLYRALGLSEWAGRAGTLLFALCNAAVIPVGWPANHNALLVAVFAVASLCLLASEALTARRIVLGVAFALAAVLSKESGVIALVLAAALLVARHRPVAALAPALLSVAYLGFVVSAGYGTASLFYATPWLDPGRFAGNLALLFTAGLACMAGPFPIDLALLLPETRPLVMAVGALIGLPLAWWVGRTVAGTRGSGWLALWTAGFLAVQAGAPPSDRLLFVPAIGGVGLLALFFERRRELQRSGRTRLAGRVLTTLLLLTSTVGSGFALLFVSSGMASTAAHVRAKALETDVGSPSLGTRELYVLQTENQMQAFSLHNVWGIEKDDHDLLFRILQSGNRPLRWKRVDDHTFDLESLGAPFLTGVFERVYLTTEPAFTAGHTWAASGFTVEALAVDDGLPVKLRFVIPSPLDAPRVRFLRPVEGRLEPVALPPVGQSIELPRPERSGPWAP